MSGQRIDPQSEKQHGQDGVREEIAARYEKRPDIPDGLPRETAEEIRALLGEGKNEEAVRLINRALRSADAPQAAQKCCSGNQYKSQDAGAGMSSHLRQYDAGRMATQG